MAERVFFVMQAGARADGGVASVTELMQRLPGPVRVVTNAETRATAAWRSAGHEVAVQPALYWTGAATSTPAPLRLLRAIRAAAHALPPSVQHIYCNDIWSVLAALPVARMRRLPLTFFVRDTKAPDERYGIHWRVALRAAHRVIALSEEMSADLHRRAGAPLRRLAYVYSIVDVEQFRPARDAAQRALLRERWDIPAADPVIVVPASVVAKKQQAEFIASCASAIAHDHPDVRIVFAGDYHPDASPYAARVRSAVAAASLNGSIRFTGYVDHMRDVYALADVVVLPSRNEGLARGMIEALACGVPFIGFDVCSAREIVERHDVGRVVPLGDWSALTLAITELLASPELRTEYGHRARAVAQELFAADRVVRRLLELEAA